MITYTVYVVDDEDLAREGIMLALGKHYRTRGFASAEAALEAMAQAVPDLVLLDIGLPGMNGIEALEVIRQRHPEVLIIMITAYEDVKSVVAAMKEGAYDYMVKPLSMDALMLGVRNALTTIALKKEIRLLQERALKDNMPCFIGESDTIQDVMQLVKIAARSADTPVLIQGETGTGKELIAKAIHFRSPHFKGELVSVNCAAIPRDLLESELFGYEKGAFSGADAAGKSGLVAKANNGTLFLDEVGDLNLEAQAKLLRFLESGEYYRVGGTRIRQVQTRVVSATNKGLGDMMGQGTFRRDLFHRLAVLKIEVPSLKERPEDIVPMARYFLEEFSRKFGKVFTGLSPEAEAALRAHPWTGNVRELKNLIERGTLLGEGPLLTPQHLGLTAMLGENSTGTSHPALNLPPLSADGVDFPSILSAIHKDYFDTALQMAGGNESKAAKLLKMSRDSFRYRRQRL